MQDVTQAPLALNMLREVSEEFTVAQVRSASMSLLKFNDCAGRTSTEAETAKAIVIGASSGDPFSSWVITRGILLRSLRTNRSSCIGWALQQGQVIDCGHAGQSASTELTGCTNTTDLAFR